MSPKVHLHARGIRGATHTSVIDINDVNIAKANNEEMVSNERPVSISEKSKESIALHLKHAVRVEQLKRKGHGHAAKAVDVTQSVRNNWINMLFPPSGIVISFTKTASGSATWKEMKGNSCKHHVTADGLQHCLGVSWAHCGGKHNEGNAGHEESKS